MARISTPRPHRIIEFYDFDAAGNVTIEAFTQEYGRRAGLQTRKSDVTERRVRANRNERRGVRRALRLGDELPQRSKGSAIYFAP